MFTVLKDEQLYSVKKYSVTAMESTVNSKVSNLKKKKKSQENAKVSAFLFWKVVYVDAASINLKTIHDFIISVSRDLV